MCVWRRIWEIRVMLRATYRNPFRKVVHAVLPYVFTLSDMRILTFYMLVLCPHLFDLFGPCFYRKHCNKCQHYLAEGVAPKNPNNTHIDTLKFNLIQIIRNNERLENPQNVFFLFEDWAVQRGNFTVDWLIQTYVIWCDDNRIQTIQLGNAFIIWTISRIIFHTIAFGHAAHTIILRLQYGAIPWWWHVECACFRIAWPHAGIEFFIFTTVLNNFREIYLD